MIRVLHSVSNMDRAGIETMVMNFYRHMDPSVVQFDFLANKPKIGAYEDEIAQMGGRVFRSPGFNPLKYPSYVRFLREILRKNPDIQIIHVHNGALGAYALLAARLCGLKNRLYHAHGTMLPAGKGRSVKALCKPFVDPLATCKLACGTEAARFYYHARTMRDKNYTLVHNAIDLTRFSYNEQTRREMRAEHGLEGHVVIGHIGRFSQQKNHLRMLDIFARAREVIPDAILVMIGEGEMWQSVEEKARAMGLSQYVRLVPPVSRTDRWYQAMDAFLLPSVWEGLPVVAIEAQAAGLPTVLSSAVTDEAKVTDLVRYVSLSETDDVWAEALRSAVAEKKPRDGTAQALADAGYDIAREAKKLQELYVRLANSIRQSETRA